MADLILYLQYNGTNAMKQIYDRIEDNYNLDINDAKNRPFTIKKWLESRYNRLDLGEIGMLVEDCGYGNWELPLPREYLHRMIPEARDIVTWMEQFACYQQTWIPSWSTVEYKEFSFRSNKFYKEEEDIRKEDFKWHFQVLPPHLIVLRPNIINKEKYHLTKQRHDLYCGTMPWDILCEIVISQIQKPSKLPMCIIEIISGYWLGLSYLNKS